MRSLLIKIMGLVALVPAAAFAFQPLITDDTGTQGEGGNQVEAAYNRSSDKTPGGRTITHEIPLVYPAASPMNSISTSAAPACVSPPTPPR